MKPYDGPTLTARYAGLSKIIMAQRTVGGIRPRKLRAPPTTPFTKQITPPATKKISVTVAMRERTQYSFA